MIHYRDIVNGLRMLDVDPYKPLIVTASADAFGEIRGGVETLLGSLLSVFDAVMMPTFTFSPMLVPMVGPENNAMEYGSAGNANRTAEFFRSDLPSDPNMGELSEALRRHEDARRSIHPLLSFTGVNVDTALDSQTLQEPLAPVRKLTDAAGWVLLMGVDHRQNIALHYAEALAGRKQFVRWALTRNGVRECPQIIGCSQGFEAVAPYVRSITHEVQVGDACVRALPLQGMVSLVSELVRRQPQALLCNDPACAMCAAVRRAVPARQRQPEL